MSAFEIDTVEGVKIGRDPRKMTQDEIKECGHNPTPVLSAIRAKCIDCCGGSQSEVRKCVSVSCSLWPFRMHKNPWREKRELSEEQIEAVRERFAMARIHGGAGNNQGENE